jgi:hypothetical protein
MALTQLNKSLNISSLTLLWPPFNIKKAIHQFDQLLMVSKPIYDKCSYFWRWPVLIYQILNHDFPPSHFDSEQATCLGAFIAAKGFQSRLKEVSEINFKHRELQLEIPESFWDFTSKNLPLFATQIQRKPNQLDLLYLINKIPSSIKVNIISSKDDFLNDISQWQRLNKTYPNINLTLFDWGGHCGISAHQDFYPLLGKVILNQ